MSCQVSHTEINGLKAIYLENDLLKVGILIDRGCDIFEFIYKPSALDFLLRLPKGISNPQQQFSQIRNTRSQFEDYYYGGWQVCLPNSPAFNYRGAELGQHGEVSLIPWNIVELQESKDILVLKVEVQPLRIPIAIVRTITLKKDDANLIIEEEVTNRSKTHLDIMWGQHIAFGLPFLKEGVTIDTNAKTMTTEPTMPDRHLFKRNETYRWPEALNKAGESINSGKVSALGENEYADLSYISGYEKEAYYSIKNEGLNVGFGLQWDGLLFKDVWYWQERNATKDFPWWGDCYTVALEPWTSKWTQYPKEAIKKGEWLRMKANEVIQTRIIASAFENKFKPVQR
ncbi:MAG: DUF4432 family protein [Cyclobacteriaceae bacterium]